MGCYYRDGNYCGFCAKYGYSNLHDAERYTYQNCTDDDYYYCPVANALMEYEMELMEEEEAEEAAREAEEAERKQREKEQQEREAEEAERWRQKEEAFALEQERLVREEEDLTRFESETDGAWNGLSGVGISHRSTHNKQRSDAWKPTKLRDLIVEHYGFSDFFDDMRTGSIPVTVFFFLLFFAGIVLSGIAGAVELLSLLSAQVTVSDFVTNLVYCSCFAGCFALFVALFRVFKWTSVTVLVLPEALWFLVSRRFMGTGTIHAVVNVIFVVISALMAIAGLLPGLLFMFIHSIVPDTLFPYASWMLPGVAALGTALPIGVFLGNRLCFLHNCITLMRYR